MSAKVYITAGQIDHERGTVLEVKEGHLLVRSGNQGDVVAIYAPDKWIRAEVSR